MSERRRLTIFVAPRASIPHFIIRNSGVFPVPIRSFAAALAALVVFSVAPTDAHAQASAAKADAWERRKNDAWF